MTAAEITLGAVVCALWAVFLILSAIGTVVTHKDAKGSTQIPFQRESESRYPIKSIKTLSVPQMIENEKVQPLIQQNIDEGLSKRLENHVKQMLAKAQG